MCRDVFDIQPCKGDCMNITPQPGSVSTVRGPHDIPPPHSHTHDITPPPSTHPPVTEFLEVTEYAPRDAGERPAALRGPFPAGSFNGLCKTISQILWVCIDSTLYMEEQRLGVKIVILHWVPFNPPPLDFQ